MFQDQKTKPLTLATAQLILIVIILIISFLIPFATLADGMRIRPNLDRWDFSGETSQQAFINYTNGTEKMILNIGIDYSDKGDSVWLFPVPASADNVEIDIVTALPMLNGEDIGKKAENTLNNAREFTLLTQIYTFPLTLVTTSLNSNRMEGEDILGSKGFDISIQDIDVYEHIEKEGVTSEIISAKNAFALYDYLKGKGLNIEIGSIPVLDQYIGKDFSFVVSWISSSEKILTPDFVKENLYSYINYANRFPKFSEFYGNLKQKYPNIGEIKYDYDVANYIKSKDGQEILAEIVTAVQEDPSLIKEKIDITNSYSYQVTSQNQRGVFVTFPTSEIYFPLMPTSVYGSEIVPATIRVAGFVTPKIPESIKAFTKVKYFIGNNSAYDDSLEDFYGGSLIDGEKNKYTKIEINAPSNFFTEDLWAMNVVPPKTYFLLFLVNNSFLVTIMLLLASSLLAAMFSGIIIFKESRNKKGVIKFGILGLFNCFTLLVFIIRVLLLKTKDEDESVKEILIKIKQKGYFWKRRLALALLVLDAPFLFVVILISPFAIYGFVDSIKEGYSHYGLIDMFGHLDAEVMFFIALPVAIALIALKLKRVKNEDKPLFEELKVKNYSLWTLEPRDARKDSFIVLFSVSFLIISWLIVKLTALAL